MRNNNIHFLDCFSLFLFSLLFCFTTAAFATEFTVSTAAQISSVMTSQAHAGDTLTMTGGTWTNQLIVFKGNGTAGHPILLRSQSGYGSVTLTGTSTLRIGGNYLVVDGLKFEGGYSSSGDVIEFRQSSSGAQSNYSRLTNSAVIDYNPANDSTDYKWISIYGTHNRVDHCYTTGKTHSGTTLVVWRPTTAANYHQIDHNYFGPRPVLVVSDNGAETIRVGTSDQSQSSSFTVVEWNFFQACNGEIEIISNKSCDNIYRYNTFLDCVGTLTLRHGNRCRVEGNFFFADRISNTGGIRIIGEDHVVVNNYVSGTRGNDARSAISLFDGIPNSPLTGYYQVKRALVAFNTLVSNDYSITIGAGKSSTVTLPPLDCTIANNVVYGTHSPLVIMTDTPINLTWQKNIMYGTSVGISPTPDGITVADPKLAPVGSDRVQHLLGASPAIDAAEGTYSTVTLDMDGQPRDALKDVGADEYSAAPVTVHPLTANDVGPNAVAYTITVEQSVHGTISPGTVALRAGESQNFTITPNPGCRLDSLLVDGIYVADSTTSYTFVNIFSSHTITARFAAPPIPAYVLNVTAEPRGAVTKLPDLAAYDSGSTVQLTATPDPWYHFVTWTGDANGTDNPISVVMDTEKTITAVFALTPIDRSVTIHRRWNLLSAPVLMANDSVHSMFPDAVTHAFLFDDGYVEQDTVTIGSGFWLKYPSDDTISCTGLPVLCDTILLRSGWNLIGSISDPVRAVDVVADSSDLIASPFYSYNGSMYVKVDTLRPGGGYWIKAREAGSIILAVPGARTLHMRNDKKP